MAGKVAGRPGGNAWCFYEIRTGIRVKIDKEDLKRVGAYKWRATKGTTGRLRIVTSITTPKGARSLTLGRFLMDPPKGKQVYPRRFNDGFDYRKSNLVVCSLKERQQLLPKARAHSSSKYRGVSYSERSKSWRAGIKVKGKTISLGVFASEDQAALAYNEAAQKYFGAFAYQNPVGRRLKKRED